MMLDACQSRSVSCVTVLADAGTGAGAGNGMLTAADVMAKGVFVSECYIQPF